MSLLGKPIEEVIETLYNSIKSKRQIINNIKNEYNINNDKFNEIKINRLKLIDLLDEFEVTISQSLQAIQTLKVEIFNIKEKQTTEEILNLTNELQMKYTTNENPNHNNNNNNNNKIFEKLEYSKTERSIIEPNDNLKKNFENNNKEFNFQNNKNNEPTNNSNNYMRDINILSEAKLNFDYSNLLNSSELSLKNSIPNLDKYRINHNEEYNDINNKVVSNKNSNININNNEKMIDNNLSNENKNNKSNENNLIPKTEIDTNKDKGNILNFNSDKNNEKFINVNDNNIDNLNNLNINNISNIKLKDEEIEEDQPSKLNINFVSLNNFTGNKTLRQDIGSLSENNNILRYNNKFNTTRKIDINNSNKNDRNTNYNFKILNPIDNNENNNNLHRLENQVEKNDIYNIENKNNKSNDDIKYKKSINIKQDQDMTPGVDDFFIKEDLNDVNANVNNNDIQDNFDESDFISIVSKKDILLEKLKKIEEEEKFNKLIEDIFSVRSFKLYILDKFGNGRFDTFIKRCKNGEINKAELESELNILKELSLKNSKSNNSTNVKNKKGSQNKKLRKNNSNRNFIDNNTMNNTANNVQPLNNMNKYNIENNYSKTSSNYKKINYEKKVNNIINKEKKINKNEYTGPLNFKNTLRDGDRSNTQINNVSFSNQNKNITSHSVNSIRARLKSKKF